MLYTNEFQMAIALVKYDNVLSFTFCGVKYKGGSLQVLFFITIDVVIESYKVLFYCFTNSLE